MIDTSRREMLVRAAIATHPMPTVTRRRFFSGHDGCSVEAAARTARCSTAPPPFRRGLRFAQNLATRGSLRSPLVVPALAPRYSRSASSLSVAPASPPPIGRLARLVRPAGDQVVLTDRGVDEALERAPLWRQFAVQTSSSTRSYTGIRGVRSVFSPTMTLRRRRTRW